MFLVGRAISERNMDFMARVLVGVAAAWIPTGQPRVSSAITSKTNPVRNQCMRFNTLVSIGRRFRNRARQSGELKMNSMSFDFIRSQEDV